MHKSIIDIESAYMRCRATKRACEVLALVVEYIPGYGDHFEFNGVMPWGTKNAGRYIQKLVERMGKFDYEVGERKFIRNLLYDCMEVFQDDMILHSDDEEQHFRDVEELLERMYCSGLVPSWSKCVFDRKEVKWCGMVISEEGVRQDPDKVAALSRLRAPESWKELESLIGKMNWHRCYAPKYAEITKPIYDLNNSRSRRKFEWSVECRKSYRKFVEELKKDVMLRSVKGDGQVYVDVDMSLSKRTLAAVLLQVQQGKEVVLGYASKKLGEKERFYGAPKLEFMAIWFGLMSFENEVRGRNPVVRSDHQSLKDMHFKEPKGIWVTWLLEVMSFDARVVHVAGKDNVVADAMSRLTSWVEGLSAVAVEDVELRKRIVRRYHSHLSLRKEIQNIRCKYVWDNMSRDVEKHINNCYYCLRNKTNGESRNKLVSSEIPNKVWEVMCIDVLPLLQLKNQEKKSVAVVVDVLSNASFIYPLRNLTASEFVEKLKKKVFEDGMTGPPKVIIGDKARQSLSGEFESFIKEYGITFRYSQADHHQGNSQVENRIKLIKNLLHSYLDEGLPFRKALRKTNHVHY